MESEAAFRAALASLVARDAALAGVVERHRPPQFWHRPPGFPTLVLLILEQQVSLSSAAAAYGRLTGRIGQVTPAGLLASSDEELRGDGFSRQKIRYGRTLASAVLDGTVDLEGLGDLGDGEVRSALTSLPGIGPWTADVYLLSCLRRPDVWPVGDRALQVAAGEVLELPAPLPADALLELGERWRPHRSTAARLLWHAYLSARGR